jgi:hypothetical protein
MKPFQQWIYIYDSFPQFMPQKPASGLKAVGPLCNQSPEINQLFLVSDCQNPAGIHIKIVPLILNQQSRFRFVILRRPGIRAWFGD